MVPPDPAVGVTVPSVPAAVLANKHTLLDVDPPKFSLTLRENPETVGSVVDAFW
jgi:hypothetical protein